MYLFCIPHAAGTIVSYFKWRKFIRKDIELIPLELPGHITRVQEKLLEDYHAVIEDFVVRIKETLKKREDTYAIWGHSMGAQLMYYLYEKLKEEHIDLPCHIFVSGRWAPSIYKEEYEVDINDEKSLQAIMEKLGGTDRSIIENESFRNLNLNILHADYKVIRSLPLITDICSFECDLSFLYGSEDDQMKEEDAMEWSKFTSKRFHTYCINGGHFYPFSNIEDTIHVIHHELEKYLD